jgi:uncharacterized protein YodC (DUF2158 family)
MYAEVSRKETEQFERASIVAALRWLCDPLRTMETLKLGDTVRLKSGGPVMTLGPEMDTGGFLCSWFDGATLQRGNFYLEQLEKAEPASSESGRSSFTPGKPV